jgi:hypothetical protein
MVLDYDEGICLVPGPKNDEVVPKSAKWKLDNRNCLVNKAYNKALVIDDLVETCYMAINHHEISYHISLASYGNEFRFCQPFEEPFEESVEEPIELTLLRMATLMLNCLRGILRGTL